jgi:hypothetical protein
LNSQNGIRLESSSNNIMSLKFNKQHSHQPHNQPHHLVHRQRRCD